MIRSLRIGTRGSPLARWQAEWVAAQLRESHPDLDVQLVEIKTGGDRDRNTPLAALGGTGLFTKEIQHALLRGDVDVAVHSLKDLPTQVADGLALAAVPPREEVADALIAPRHGTLEALPPGAKVGTGSPRRRAQLLWLRPDLDVVGLRGNVETRLAHAIDGRLDAVVLAEAGLRRLELEGRITEQLGPPRFLPAVGQGALGIECRSEDAETLALLAVLDDPDTRPAVLAERAALAELEAGCMVPLGAWGRVGRERLQLDLAVFSPDGSKRLAASRSGPIESPEELGRSSARELIEQGAASLLGDPPPPGPG